MGSKLNLAELDISLPVIDEGSSSKQQAKIATRINVKITNL